MKINLDLLEVVVDAREDDDLQSWEAGLPYRDALEYARSKLSPDRHIITLSEYLELWCKTIIEQGSRACNEADVWVRNSADRDEKNPLSLIRHPYQSTVLVDTNLRNVKLENSYYMADVYQGDLFKQRVSLPVSGKIYEIDEYGLPGKTGGQKCDASGKFEHRWWAFSTDQLTRQDGFALFANGGTIGCFCELVKAHYSLDDYGGFYRILSLPN